MIAEDYMITTDGLFDGTTRTVRLDSQRRHPLSGSATECGGLEDFPCVRKIGSASHLVRSLRGKACDKLPDQAASVVAFYGYLSKRDLHFFDKLLPLLLRKTNDQTDETR
jgi:hypothetical protein